MQDGINRNNYRYNASIPRSTARREICHQGQVGNFDKKWRENISETAPTLASPVRRKIYLFSFVYILYEPESVMESVPSDWVVVIKLRTLRDDSSDSGPVKL